MASPRATIGLPLPSAVLSWTRHWIAIDKPSGLPSRPAPGHPASALSLLEQWLAANAPGAPRPGVVHRLDRDTSGVLIFSLGPQGHRALTAALAARHVEKEYLAIVSGWPRPRRGAIDLPLRRNRSGRMVVDAEGLPSLTRYETLRRFEGAALLRVQPASGRMHQIRVHLSARGTPVLGDPTYGRRAGSGGVPKAPRLCLHCSRLVLPEEMIRALPPLQDERSGPRGTAADRPALGTEAGPSPAARSYLGGPFAIEAAPPEDLTRYLAALTGPPNRV